MGNRIEEELVMCTPQFSGYEGWAQAILFLDFRLWAGSGLQNLLWTVGQAGIYVLTGT